MKRWMILILILAVGPILWAQEGRTWVPQPFVLPPFSRFQTVLPCVAGQESRAMCIGDGRSPLAIYVFDSQGNCVAADDEPSGYYDDRIAEWTPSATGAYEVQIRNLGPCFNRVEANAK